LNLVETYKVSYGDLSHEDCLNYSLGNPLWGGMVGQNINCCTGNFYLQETDLSIPTRSFPLNFTRSYNSRATAVGPLGKGWQHNYNVSLKQNPDETITFTYEDGHEIKFESDGTSYYTFSGDEETLTSNKDGTFALSLRNNIKKYVFSADGKLQSISDKNGNTTTLTYTGELLTTVTEPAGRTLQFNYNSNGNLNKVLDSAGRFVEFTYDANGNLNTVRNLNGEVTSYLYDSLGLTAIVDPQNNTVLTNTYDGEGRVIQQIDGKGNIVRMAYNSATKQNTYTDARNYSSVYTYDLDYRLRKIEYYSGETASFEYDWKFNLISTKDFNGIITEYVYDRYENLRRKSIKGQSGYEEWEYHTIPHPDMPPEYISGVYKVPYCFYDANRQRTNFFYDQKEKLTAVAIDIGNGKRIVHRYAYDSYGQVIRYTDPENRISTFDYDQYGNLLTVTDPEGKVTTYTYDAAGRIASITDSKDGVTSYTYDNTGNLLTVTDPAAGVITYLYDSNGNLSSITDQRGKTTTYQYDENGNLIQVTDPLLNITTFTHDGDGNCRTVTNAKGQTTTYNYDHRNRLVSITDHAGNTESYTLDGNGNVIARTDAGNNTVSYEYDYANRLVKIIDPLGHSFSNSYDPVGNKIAETDPFGNETEYIYDEASRLIKVIDPRDNTIINTYNLDGQLLSITDAENNITAYTYDGCGRLKTVVDALTNQTAYTYDANGNLINVLDALNQNRTMQYDALNREIAEINDNGDSISKEYDAVGNLISLTTLKGDTIIYEYDDLNRLIKKRYPDDTTVTYTYNELGQRTSMTDPAGTTTYTYDNLNRLQTVTRNGTTITYAYDAFGNITDIIYPNGQHLQYTYNELNLPETVSDGSKTQSVSYDIAAQPVQETMPNGVTVNYEFDECGRLTLLENKLNGSSIAKIAYTYDKNGNRVSCTNKDGQVTTYAYDALNQLKEVQGSKLTEYLYDPVGNRINISETVNEEKLQAGSFDFDYEDRLIRTEKPNETISYIYDGDGTLVQKTVTNGTESMNYEYFYDYTAGLPRLLVEKKSDGTNYNYHYFGGKLYGRTGPEGTVYYHHDGLGSVVAITDANGNILNEYAYEVFGEPTIIKETVENSIMFTGEPYDQSGFIYLRARYYDPIVGRFVSSDKYKGEIADPSSQNSYAYCGNNPVNYVDPSGYKEVLLRRVIERAGGTIEWDPVKRTATASIAGQKVVYRPDSDERISINSKGQIVIDDFYLDEDFSSVVGHLWGDRRLGLSKLDVYSNRMFFWQSLKKAGTELGKLPGEFKAIANDPNFRQSVKNTAYAVINVHIGGFEGFVIDKIIPSSGDPQFDRAVEIAGYAQILSPSLWLDIRDNINDLRSIFKIGNRK